MNAPSVENVIEKGRMQGVGSGTLVRRLRKWLRRYAWCLYLGGAFSAAGWHYDMWQFYAAILPIHILVAWGRDA